MDVSSRYEANSEQDLGDWIVRQWKRRGIISDREDALAWFRQKSPKFQETVRTRMASGWQVPKI